MQNKNPPGRFFAGRLLIRFLSLLIAATLLAPGRAAAIGAEIRDSEIEAALYDWALPLTNAAKIKNPKIHILSDRTFNAFVISGGDIFVNTGLLTKIESPAELQAVLAHEVGHVALGHASKRQVRAQAELGRSLIMQALGLGLLAVNPAAAAAMVIGSAGVAAQGMMAYSRDDEREADNYAVKTLIKSGIDPNALISVFQTMRSAAEDKINPNLVGHPLTEERIKNIKLQIQDAGAAPRKAKDKDRRLALIQAKLIGYLDSPERVKTLYPAGDKSDAALYARAISRMKSDDLDLSKTGAKTLIARQPVNPYFHELLGDIEFKSGNYGAAIAAYQSAGPHDKPQIELAQALALTERNLDGDRAKATFAAKRAILTEPMPLAWWILAKADADRAEYYLAEYYYMMKDLPRAKGHAKKAVQTLPPDSPEYLKAKDILD